MSKVGLFIAILLLCLGCSEGAGHDTDGDASEKDNDNILSDGDAESLSGLFKNPHDGKLYVAAGYKTITPNDQNHPCAKYMGGTGSGRLSEGIHDDLEARAFVMEQDGVHAVLVSLDLIGWIVTNADNVMNELEKLGVNRNSVIISSTHTHTAADSLGVFGPDYNTSGACPEYHQFLRTTIVELVTELSTKMLPVTVTAAEKEIDEKDANHPELTNDLRLPFVTNKHLTAARFVDSENKTVATLVNYHPHPETMIEKNVYSADFPRWTRKKVEDEFGGTCVYFSGTVGGMATPLGLNVPERDADGKPVMKDGKPVIVEEDGERKCYSMGYLLGENVIDLLKQASVIDSRLILDFEPVDLPLENPIFALAFNMGILEPYDKAFEDKEKCGPFFCLPMNFIHIQLGILHFVHMPGEVLAESSVGREASHVDYAAECEENGVKGCEKDCGVKEYPAIVGYRNSLPQGHLLMELGLGNNEIGYILPESDYMCNSHPHYYEEYFTVSKSMEKLVRENVSKLLERSEK